MSLTKQLIDKNSNVIETITLNQKKIEYYIGNWKHLLMVT